MHKVLIEVIITNQCNKRCEYCDLDFRTTFISDEHVESLTSLVNRESEKLEYIHLNFFGWEPLLWFDKIRKIVEWMSAKNVKYSLGTNGNLLNSEILDFLSLHNFLIHLSVDNISWYIGVPHIASKYHKNIKINFINDPDYLFRSEQVFQDIYEKGFRNINFMPVFSTKKWQKWDIISLGKIYKKILSYEDIELQAFWYFNGVSGDMQFVLDTDGYLYNDLDSLLWLQKQYKNLESELREKINSQTKGVQINKNLSIEKLLSQYNIQQVLGLVMEIPKSQWYLQEYELIKKVFEYGNGKIWM